MIVTWLLAVASAQTCEAPELLSCEDEHVFAATVVDGPSAVQGYSCSAGDLMDFLPERVYELDLASVANGSVILEVHRDSAYDGDAFVLEGACDPQACKATTYQGVAKVNVLPDTRYFLVVESVPGEPFDLTLSCLYPPDPPETEEEGCGGQSAVWFALPMLLGIRHRH